MAVSVIASGGVLLFLSVAPVDFVVLCGALVAGGAVNAFMQPALSRFITENSNTENLPRIFSIKLVSAPVALMVGGFSVSLIGIPFGWQRSFIAGLPLVLMYFLLLGRGFRKSTTNQSRPAEEPDSHPLSLVLPASLGLATAGGTVIAGFGVSELIESGWSPIQAGYSFAACGILGVVFRLLSGFLSHPSVAVMLARSSRIILLGSFGYVLLLIPDKRVAAFGVFLAYSVGWSWPALTSASISILFRPQIGRAVGLTQTGVYLGSVIGPVGFALVYGAFGPKPAWLGTATVVFIGAASLYAYDLARVRQVL